ncbi:MAG: ABC transporter permease [Lachnospiraceae bacterium]|nr:ABC transporter permease [Lachnospiraceae bacterium]
MRKTIAEKQVSGGMVRRLASNLYHADRRRNITAIAAIALSSMLIIMALSAILSIEAAMRRSRQMLIGTKAEGVYTFLSYNWFEALRDSGHFDAMAMVFHLGWYETASSTGDGNRILSTDEETASWNFNELLEGRWAKELNEIVVDARFVQENGGAIKVGDTFPVTLKTGLHEYRQDMVICGICACNEALDETRIYVSKAFLDKDLSGFGQQAFCRFEKGRYTDEDLKSFLREVNPYADCNAFVNPSAGDQPEPGCLKLIAGLIGLTGVCAGLMIYTIYYISMVKNVAQYGQLKLIGVTSRQIRAIVRRHAIRQYLTGLPIGCLLGAVFGYALMPFLSALMGMQGTSEFTVRPAYFLCAAALSAVVVYFGVRRPMRILAKTPPVHAAGFTGSGKISMGKVRNGRFTPGRFARRNIRRRRKNTALVAFSMSIVVLLFVATMNIINSLDLDAFLSMFNLFADIEIAADDYLFGLELGYADGIIAIPHTVRDELEKIPEDVETVYHYQLQAPVAFYGAAAERYCGTVLDSESYRRNVADDEWLNKRMVGAAEAYREKKKPFILMMDYFRFYDFDRIADFEVFEGSLDREKFESGDYVLAVALDKDGNSLYHAGDVVQLADEFPEKEAYSFKQDADGKFPYVDALQKKEYTVMAVVGDAYRNQMAWGDENTTGFEYILPAQLMESFDRMPDLFLVTMDAPDAETLARAERYVQQCLEKTTGEVAVSCRSKGTYRAGLERVGMTVSLFGNGLALMVGVMALVNFLNSTVSSIAERKEEFSTLQAIGMMKQMLLKVLRLENVYTVLLAVIPGYLLGQFFSIAAIHRASESLPYLRCHVTLLPGILLAAGMGLLSVSYPNRGTDVGDKRRRR